MFFFQLVLAGGTHRDLLEAAKKGPVFVEMVKRKCPNCKTYTSKIKCPIAAATHYGKKLSPLWKSFEG